MAIMYVSILSVLVLRMGVKSTLVSKPVAGLVKCDDFGQYNEKAVYVNPYALPMAFVYRENDRPLDPANPFVYFA